MPPRPDTKSHRAFFNQSPLDNEIITGAIGAVRGDAPQVHIPSATLHAGGAIVYSLVWLIEFLGQSAVFQLQDRPGEDAPVGATAQVPADAILLREIDVEVLVVTQIDLRLSDAQDR